MATEEHSLVQLAVDSEDNVQALERFKSRLPEIQTPDLVTGYVHVKDLSKKLDSLTKAMRTEFLDEDAGRFWTEPEVEVSDRGHRTLYGHDSVVLKAEKRVSKPKLNQEKAREFFEEKGLLSEVAEIDVNLSTEDVKELLSIIASLDGVKAKVFGWLGIQTTENVKEMKYRLRDFVQKVEEKGKLMINEDKVEALVTMEKIKLSEIEHLYEIGVTYALKGQK